jgi:hypothetical protein
MKTSRSLVIPEVAAGFCLAATPTSASGFGGSASLTLVDSAAEWLGFATLSGADRDALALGVALYALVFGYLTDLVLADHGFGRIGNALVGIFGAGLGYGFGAPLLRHLPASMQSNLTLTLCGCASALMLMFCALAKRVGHRWSMRFWNHVARRKRRPPETPEEMPPRVAAALRKS